MVNSHCWLCIDMVNTTLYNCHITGCPSLLRGDRGSENAKVIFLQPFLRRNGQDGLAGENSFQYGRSVSNQVNTEFTVLFHTITLRGWYSTEDRRMVVYTAQMVHRLVDNAV